MLNKEEKIVIINEFHVHENDTGSSEVQIAILTNRIKSLSAHLLIHKHDHSSRRGLLKMVGQRKRMLKYLKSTKPSSYEEIIKKLSIRG
jgi:small subunit ribosomal protein S15